LPASLPEPAFAQNLDDLGVSSDPNAQLLLQADDLIYDNDSGTVVADGDVRIDYDGNRLVAARVTYVESTGRLIAQGGVELLQPDGTRTFADELDITDDFGNGFITLGLIKVAEIDLQSPISCGYPDTAASRKTSPFEFMYLGKRYGTISYNATLTQRVLCDEETVSPVKQN